MFLAVVVVVILGTVAVGGPAVVWNLNDLGGRLIITKYVLRHISWSNKKNVFVVLPQVCTNVTPFLVLSLEDSSTGLPSTPSIR